MPTFDPSTLLLSALTLGSFVLKLYALVDAARRPAAAFPIAGKLTKPIWLVILIAAVLLNVTGAIGIFGLIGLVAAIVYLVDVRPAVTGVVPGGPWG